MKGKFTFFVIFSSLCTLSLDAIGANYCFDLFRGKTNSEFVPFGGAKTSRPVQDMANLLLSEVPSNSREQVQIAIPMFLRVNQKQPEQFFDGQKNAMADYGSLQNAPFIALLTRALNSNDPSQLMINLSKALPGYKEISSLEVSIEGQTQTAVLDAAGRIQLQINLKELGWDGLYNAKPVFFRPQGWSDWFAVQFPNANMSINQLLNGMQPKYQALPDGKSIVDPLGLKDLPDVQNGLREIDASKNLGFELARVDRVHGSYISENGAETLTSTGGVWTRYREGEPFKIVYLVKDPRNIEKEAAEKVVSGTGPHFIGANAEIILNSLGKKELMTFYGVPNPSVGPDGAKLAWNFSHQWIGTWLRPGQAFVTPQGMFHWHLNHLTEPVAAQVLTPPEVPNPQNHFGFPKR